MKENYDLQVETLIERFCEKGYKSKDLRKAKALIRDMETEHAFKKKESKKRDQGVSFVMGFTCEYRQFEKIIKEKLAHIIKG